MLGLALGKKNNPEDEGRDVWEGVGSSVEDAEPCAILGRGVLAGW